MITEDFTYQKLLSYYEDIQIPPGKRNIVDNATIPSRA